MRWAARAPVPAAGGGALLVCGDAAGATQAAIRARTEAIAFTGPADVAEPLADIALQRGIDLVVERPAAALDLGRSFFAPADTLRRYCADILASGTAFC